MGCDLYWLAYGLVDWPGKNFGVTQLGTKT